VRDLTRREGKTADDARALAERLCDAGYLRRTEAKPGPAGGRRSEVYSVHPELLAGGGAG
jgi:hypothetical protein